MAAFMCIGGPEPSDGGRLNVIRLVVFFFIGSCLTWVLAYVQERPPAL